MWVDPVVITLGDSSLMGGDLMSTHELDWLPVVEKRGSRRLTGVIRPKRILQYLDRGKRHPSTMRFRDQLQKALLHWSIDPTLRS